MKNRFASAVLLFFILVSASVTGAQENRASSGNDEAFLSEFDFLPDMEARGKYLTIKIAVAGPGDELYLMWGHIGLVIEDALSGESRFYDWGVFSFDTENFYYDFAFGRLFYSCAVSPAEYNLGHMMRENRDMTLYTLDLPPEVKTELLLFAENNVLPENRNYLYHHFRDNCATRVRDILNMVTGGDFAARYFDAPGRYTLRQHVRRHTWFSPFWDWFFNFLMGQDIDRPITVWEEMFLPSEIALCSKDFKYTDAWGAKRQLVSKVEVLSKAKGRHAVAEIPPKSWIIELLLGLGLAVILGILRIRAATPEKKRGGLSRFYKAERGSRYAFGILQAAMGLFFGLMGSLLFFMSFFTTHDYTWHNSNILFVNPLFLAAFPLALIAAFGRKIKKRERSEYILQILWTVVFIGGIITIVIRLFPNFYQQNQPTQALLLPAAFVLSIIPPRLFPPR